MLLLERVCRTRNVDSDNARTITYIICSAIFVAILTHLFMFALEIPAEAAVAYQGALLVMDGKIPYIDFLDVTAPGLMQLCVIPAIFSKLIPLVHPIIFFNVFVLLLAIGSTSLSSAILFGRRTREVSHVPYFIIGFTLLNLIALGEFGQREHLFLLLYMPFFITRWMSWSGLNQGSGWNLAAGRNVGAGTNLESETETKQESQVPSTKLAAKSEDAKQRSLAIVAGITGGISICLDPLFIVFAFLIELFFFCSKLRWRPFWAIEVRACLPVIAIYFAHFLFYPLDYAHLYFNYALPMVLCDYITFDDRLWWVNKSPDNREIVYLMVLATAVGLGVRRWCGLIVPCLAIAAVGFFLFVLEGKSMTYQMLPILYGSVLTIALVISVCANYVFRNFVKIRMQIFKPVFAAAVCGAVVIAYALQLTKGAYIVRDLSQLGYVGSSMWNEESVFSTRLEAMSKPGDKVLILNDRVRPTYPLMLQVNRKPASYLITGYPIRMSRLLMERDPSRATSYSGPQFQMYEKLIQDIKTVKPPFVMIEKESLGEVLKDHKVMDAIDEMYEEFAGAEWPDNEKYPSYDYYGFRTPLNCYKLKTEEPPTN